MTDVLAGDRALVSLKSTADRDAMLNVSPVSHEEATGQHTGTNKNRLPTPPVAFHSKRDRLLLGA